MSRSRVSVMLVARGVESSTRTTISCLMVLITKSSRSAARETSEHRLHTQKHYWFKTQQIWYVDKSTMKIGCRVDVLAIKSERRSNIPYSVLSPQSFTLFASYWAFFLRRQALQNTTDDWHREIRHTALQPASWLQLALTKVIKITYHYYMSARFYLDASLFFSLRDRGRAVSGSSLTGVKSLITLFSLRSSVPICSNLRGLGVRSSTSVRRDFFSMYFPAWRVIRDCFNNDSSSTDTCRAMTRQKGFIPISVYENMISILSETK